LAVSIAASQQSNTLAREAIEAQNRPWLGIDGDITNPRTEIIPGANPPVEEVSFNFNLRNYGQSPATQVAYRFRLASGIPKPSLFQVPDDICSSVEERSSRKNSRPVLKTVFLHEGNNVPEEGAADSLPGSLDGNLMVGCIAYQALGNIYNTRVIYRLANGALLTQGPVQYNPVKEFKLINVEAK